MVDMEKTEKRKYVRKKKHLKLSPEWIVDHTPDFEYHYYKLMDFIKYSDSQIDKFELYPLFSEVSLHLANLQSISNDSKYITINKKFKSVDDEILITDLKFNSLPDMSDNEIKEFDKILKYSGQKIFEYFNIVKALWTISYDSISINIVNREKFETIENGYFYCQYQGVTYIWKYSVKISDVVRFDYKKGATLVYEEKNEKDVFDILKEINEDNTLPVFEMSVKNDLPLENTLLPIFKRKLLTYITQAKTIVILKKP
jgi:hypothetical protein